MLAASCRASPALGNTKEEACVHLSTVIWRQVSKEEIPQPPGNVCQCSITHTVNSISWCWGGTFHVPIYAHCLLSWCWAPLKTGTLSCSGGHIADSCLTWCLPGPSAPFLPSCFPCLPMSRTSHSPLMNFSVSVISFLHPLEIPLDGSTTLWHCRHVSHCCVISKKQFCIIH